MDQKIQLRPNLLIALFVCNLVVPGLMAEESNQEKKNPIGIVEKFSAGFDVRTAVGNKKHNQSPFGGALLLLQPTSRLSHLRLTTGVPMVRSETIRNQVRTNAPDIYACLEHEWGLKYVGITAGIAFTHMYGFDTVYTVERYPVYDSTFTYEDSYLYNLVFGIRAGKPYAGFRGRISFPFLGAIDVSKPENHFLEYSAYGFFGSSRMKAGFGINGFLRTWGHIFSDDDDYYYYDDDDPPVVREFQAVIPGFKFATLIGKHNIITVSAELGGIFVPRIDNWWAPEIGLSYVFSFGALRDPSSLDGKF